MAEHSELKRLAESLNRAIEQAEHKPGQWVETAQSMGGICCAGEPFQIGKPWAKEEPWAHFSFKRDSWLAVAAVNALPQLMALIAENEQLSAITEGLTKDHIDGGWTAKGIRAHCKKVEDERDQFKAEVEGLRKDAERYRGVRRVANSQGWSDERFDASTDQKIARFDAATGKGEQS